MSNRISVPIHPDIKLLAKYMCCTIASEVMRAQRVYLDANKDHVALARRARKKTK
jgi:hypothetical protein